MKYLLLLLICLPTTLTLQSSVVEERALTFLTETDSVEMHEPDSATVAVDRHLRLQVIGGMSLRLTNHRGIDSALDYRTGSIGGLLRLMIVPEHLLRVGVETGYLPISRVSEVRSDKTTPRELLLTATPIFLALAIGGDAFEFGGGFGAASLVVSAGKGGSRTITSSGLELGFFVNTSWHFSLFGSTDLGLDLHVYDFADRPITMAMLGLSIRTSLLDL